MILNVYASSLGLTVKLVFLLQHLLEFNDRTDLGHEDRDMLIEDLVLIFY